MKIRNGFVSNSSSSSFCIYGGEVDFEVIAKVFEKHGREFDKEDEYENRDTLEALLKELDLGIKVIYTDEYYCEGNYLLGRDFDCIGDNETGGQFKKSVRDGLEKLTGQSVECSSQEHAWRDG